MNKQVRRTLVAATASLALAVPLMSGPSAVAQGSAAAKKADKFVNHGMKGAASGARLIVNNVEVLNINDALAPLRCTRRVNRGAPVNSVLSTPEGSPIQLAAVTNQSRSYKVGDRVGVRSSSELAPIQIGDSTGQLTGGIPTPEISITGLTTVADAFHNKSGYGHSEEITELELKIDLLPGQDADQPLQDLLDAIDTELLEPVLEVLQTTVLAGPIKIPGLGSISLGAMRGKATDTRAESHASALEIMVEATGEKQRLILGDVHSRIGGPAPAGVFRSTSMPLHVDVADGVVRLGHVKPRSIRCEGTGGKERVQKIASASVVLPDGMIAGVKGVEYRSMGKQNKNGSARGYQISKIGSFTIPSLDLSIEGISSKVGARSKSVGSRVKKSDKVSVATIVHNGVEYSLKPGQSKLIDGLGIIESRVVTDGTKWGQRVTALRVSLDDFPVTFDLGIAATRISPY